MRRAIAFAGLVVVAASSAAIAPPPAVAVVPAPAWTVSSVAAPTNFKPGDKKTEYFYEVTFANEGGAVTDGTPIVLTDTLPAGLTVKSVTLPLRGTLGEPDLGPTACETHTAGEVRTVVCTIAESLPGTLNPARLEPSEHLTALIRVTPPASASGELTNVVDVEGGGAPPASVESQNPASAELASAGLSMFRAALTDVAGQPASRAASHPFQYTTSFAVNTKPAPAGSGAIFVPAGGNVKDILVKLPPGLVGNPNTTEHCTAQQFATAREGQKGSRNVFLSECPDSSAIGVVTLLQVEGHLTAIGVGAPVYNLVPPPGMPAQFGFEAAGAPIYIDAELVSDPNAPGGHRIVAHLRNTSEAKLISAASVTIWGVPGDPIHNPLRGNCSLLGGSCPPEGEPWPFLRLPTSCEFPMLSEMEFDTWSDPGAFLAQPASEPPPVGCDLPEFTPTIEAQPTTNAADSPSGLHVDLHIPQRENEEDPAGLGEADLRDATVALPPGMSVNPASADGLGGCTPAQIGLETPVGQSPPSFDDEPAACPDASKVGQVEIETPLLDHPPRGAVYLASQGQNPFGSLIAIYVTVDDPVSGVVVKLAGKVTPDPVTGRLVSTFSDNPQLPFEDFRLDFFGGARGSLRTPPSCGSYSTTTDLEPWTAPDSGPHATPSNGFSIVSGPAGACPSGALAPKLSAGLAKPTAGASSPFLLRLSREDGTGEFARVAAATPPGLTAKLKGVPYCPEAGVAQATGRNRPGDGAAELASPSCPASSQVGTISAGAGAGPSPFYTGGKVYLAGPYAGAPLSLLAVVPAIAGPFDLGVVTNRVALDVNPETAQVTARSDPLPTILAGIPLDVRDIRLDLDRPDFARAPTNCEPMTIGADVLGVSGASSQLSERFQVGDCAPLRFRPKLKLALKGSTKRSGNPALRATLTMPPGGTNVAKASVALPHSEFLDQGHIRTVCTRVQFAAGAGHGEACPAGSIYGFAKAWSPLLDKPLSGPVYLRSSSHQLPDLVAALGGQIFVALDGTVDSVHGGIRNRFQVVPDAPVSKFELTMQGGAKGLLQNSTDLCQGKHRATANFNAQNGKAARLRPVLAVRCAKGKDGKKHRGHRRRR